MVNPVLEPETASLRPMHLISWPELPSTHPRGSLSRGARQFSRCSLDPPANNQVHVWAAWLEAPAPAYGTYDAILSASERERASRFHFAEHRRRYTVAHGWLRQLLGAYVGRSPATLEFELGPKGKPTLAPACNSTDLQFNLAHSEDLSLVAVCRKAPVGVDVERVRAMTDAADLVTRFFSKREAAKFNLLPDQNRAAAFFNLWTRKEAWLKATGQGIGHLLEQVEVSFLPEEPARLLKVPAGFWNLYGGPEERRPKAVPHSGPLPFRSGQGETPVGRAEDNAEDLSTTPWSLSHLEPAAGFVGACVVGAEGFAPVCRQWNHDFAEASL